MRQEKVQVKTRINTRNFNVQKRMKAYQHTLAFWSPRRKKQKREIDGGRVQVRGGRRLGLKDENIGTAQKWILNSPVFVSKLLLQSGTLHSFVFVRVRLPGAIGAFLDL